MACAIDRPRPLPGIACCWASEERKNRLNSRSCSCERDADAGVGHREDRVGALGRERDADPAALGRELHGVADQVDHDPLQHVAVAEERDRLVGQVDGELERRAARASARPRWCRRRRSCAGRPAGRRTLSPSSCTRDSVSRSSMSESSRLLFTPSRRTASSCSGAERAVGAVLEHLGVAEDAGDRRAQLVAHAGDERVLDLVDLAQPLDRLPLGRQRLHQPLARPRSGR